MNAFTEINCDEIAVLKTYLHNWNMLHMLVNTSTYAKSWHR